MANGEDCIHCGWQETSHLYQHQYGFSCDGFASTVTHHRLCPQVDEKDRDTYCSGDCKAFVHALRLRQVQSTNLGHRPVYWLTRHGGVVDIGS